MRKYSFKTAVDCQDGQHRRKLERVWNGSRPTLCIIGLNPSYADAGADDRTLQKMVKIADRHGFGACTVINLFSKRSPSFKEDLRGKELSEINDELNNLTISTTIDEYDTFWLAWGHDGKYLKRDEYILDFLINSPERKKLLCIGTCKNGAPIHPGHQSNDSVLRPFSPTTGDFIATYENSKKRDYHGEVQSSLDGAKFMVLISNQKYHEYLKLWNEDLYAQSILEKQSNNPDIGSSLVATQALKDVFKQYGVNYVETSATLCNGGSTVLKTGDFIIGDQTYLIKSSFRYSTIMVNTRYDMNDIDIVIGAQVVKAPPGSGYYCTVYFFGAKAMRSIKFNRAKDDYHFTTLKPTDFEGNGFFQDGIISLPI